MIHFPGYNISEKLYESNTSHIYRGRRVADGQLVVLKMLKEEYPSPERIAWFRHEYEVTRAIALPGVIEVYALESRQSRWAIVMEDFGAESLARLELAGRFTLPDFLTFALEITAILDQIHRQRIIHKDLNPSNILLNPASGQVKIIDFGISTVLSHEHPPLYHPGMVQGTLAYISPEQTGRMNRALDYRTDFYSLGVTFYELLTGRLPFDANDPLELIHAHIARDPAPPTLRDEVPRVLSEIILKLMAKNAEERYQSAWGLRADLKWCLEHLTDRKDIAGFRVGQDDYSGRFLISQKLYGRNQQIERLRQTFARVADGAAELVFVGRRARRRQDRADARVASTARLFRPRKV